MMRRDTCSAHEDTVPSFREIAALSIPEQYERILNSVKELGGSSALTGILPDTLSPLRDAIPSHPDRSCDAPHLSGVVLPVKDLYDVAGLPTRNGAAARRYVPQKDDAIVQWLRRCGATLCGKTQTSEMGLSAYTEPVALPPVENPLLPGCTPGGSSGGAAVAVARGIVPVAHASDGGGSIRVPAACCGLVGFKPPHNAGGGRLVAQGFIVRSLDDVLALYPGYARRVDTALARPLRVGFLLHPLHGDGGRDSVAPPMVTAVECAAERLRAAGHSLVELDPPYGSEVFDAFSTIIFSKAASLSSAHSPLTMWLRERGRRLSSSAVHQAHALSEALPEIVRSRWPVDVVLSPTLAYGPPPLGTFSSLPPSEDFREQTIWTPWASLWNLTGGAALSFPLRGSESALAWSPSIHLGVVSAQSDAATLLAMASLVLQGDSQE